MPPTTPEVWVTGMAACSVLGLTLDQTWQALLQGRTGIVPRQPWAAMLPLPLALMGDRPASVAQCLAEVTPAALADAGLSPQERFGWGIAVGSSRGYQAELEALIAGDRSLTLGSIWPQIYGRSPAVWVAQQLPGTASLPIQSPRAACATGLWAIIQGVELIQTGQCEVVLGGAVEAPITPLTLAGFQSMGALSPGGAFPFDRQRTGFVLGEGAALLVLERRDHAEQRGARPYGQILGFGLTNDAYHCSAPAPDGVTALIAVQDCLARSGLSPSQVGYIHAHGTGTLLNDAREADLIQALFPRQTAVSSTKGATGHTLGASGALGAVFCLMALYEQILPPCVGLTQPAYDLNWVFQSRSADLEAALCFSFGFGGQNAAIAFGSVQD